MTVSLEYHKPMRPSLLAPVALFASLTVALFLAAPAQAQINGAPSSVTSPGFGGRPINGPRASVTSPGPEGWAPAFPFTRSGNGFHNGDQNGHHGTVNNDGHRHRDRNSNSNNAGYGWYAYPVPYALDNNPPADQSQADEDADYQGGPTVFDRRGSGERSYVPPEKQAVPSHAPEHAEAEAPPVEPDPPLPPTVLVFKDGHKSEVENYAIQGNTLFDLTAGRRRRIAIADLDLEATRRQNDERGVTFQLPQSTKVN